MTRLSPRARWLAAGLALALAAALAAEHRLLERAREAHARLAAQRTAVVGVRALAEVVSRAGGQGDEVRRAVERFAAAQGELAPIRVVDFNARSLEASTAPADQGEQAAPRRLVREEKDLYDQAQRLRAAVETNRQEGVSRKDEVEIERTAGGGFRIAAPVEPAGEVTGAVIAERPPPAAPPAAGWGGALLALLAAVGLFAALAWLLGDRPAALAAAAVVLLAAAALGYAAVSLGGLAADRMAMEEAVAGRLASTARLAESVLGDASFDAAAWDADVYRRGLGFVAADGTIDAAAVTADLGRTRTRLWRAAAGVTAAALALLLFVGLGGAGRLAVTVVRHRVAYAYVLPAIVAMVVLVFFPFAYGIALSFTESTLYNESQGLWEKWIGVDNYADILSDVAVVKQAEQGSTYDYENFYWTLGFTVVWTVVNVAFGVTLGLFLALLLNRQGLALRPVYRVLLILPWAVPNYITALVWKGMFHQQFGVVNQIVQMLGLAPVAWFEHPFTSFLAIWATNGWLSFPFMMVISLGALQSIPGDLYEAAEVDGASRWQQFRSITLPSLKPALVPAVIISVIWTFNMFNIPYLTSGGEPAGATEILITGAYKIAFQKYQYGYAAAYATIIFLILLAYGTWQNRVTRATEAVG